MHFSLPYFMSQFSFGIIAIAYNGGTLVELWKSEGPPLLKFLSLNGTFVYDAVLDSLTGFVGKIHHQSSITCVHSSSTTLAILSECASAVVATLASLLTFLLCLALLVQMVAAVQ